MVPLLLSFSQFSAILGLRVCVASTEEVRATSMQDLELQLDYSIDAENGRGRGTGLLVLTWSLRMAFPDLI